MITKHIEIGLVGGRRQYLTDVLPHKVIPTNTILYKKLTGLGATYGEIKANRNSVIIEPNKPVIIGKCNDPKHRDDNLFGSVPLNSMKMCPCGMWRRLQISIIRI